MLKHELQHDRRHQAILIASTVLASWLGMQMVHESGHLLGAWLTGGQVVNVVLHPLAISRTDLAENPHPLLVVWAGPVVGVLLPLAAWGLAARFRMPGSFLLRFFAGFCLIANGGYIALGSFGRIGDCGEMLRAGTPIGLLWLFGLATIPTGFWMWHGQGPQFGLGPDAGQVSPAAAYASLIALASLLVAGFVIGGE